MLRLAVDLNVIKVELVLQGPQNVRVIGSRCLPLKFQKKAWEAWQCASERVVHEAVRVKTKFRRPQEVGEARNMGCLRKAISCKQK